MSLALALLTLVAPARIEVIAHAQHIARVQKDYGRLPLSFEANQGQTDGHVKFLSRGSGYTLFLTSTEAVLTLHKSAGKPSAEKPTSTSGAVVRMKLIGANAASRITGLQTLPGTVNYFIGNDRSKWRTNVSTYARVQYERVYPGVDLVYNGHQQQLEYDFVVAAGADPGLITLAFEGAGGLEIDAEGDLVLSTVAGDLRMHRPRVYQEVGGVKQRIPSRYVLDNERQVGFHVAAYDRSKPLVIDPVLSYSTYLGGSGVDQGSGIAVDGAGNAYVTGVTGSTDFPTSSGAFQTAISVDRGDAFVTKLDPTGSAVVYATYLGGGTGAEQGFGIAVDGAGNAYVTGETLSSDFPTTVGAFQTGFGGIRDVFVTKLDPTGSALVYSTYLGGSHIDEVFFSGIAVDSAGNAYVTGATSSTDFPTTPGAFQTACSRLLIGGGACSKNAFVTKLNSTGAALVYSTYLGGSGGDQGLDIAVDDAGHAYVTGTTGSPGFGATSFPTTAGAFQTACTPRPGRTLCSGDAFVTKLDPTGSTLVYSSYLGGSGDDRGRGIAVDSLGNAYVTGTSGSTNFPTMAAAFQTSSGGGTDAFVTKLDPTGSALVYSTYLGGSSGDLSNGIAVDGAGNAYVTGQTLSTNFPSTTGAFQTAFGGGSDTFVTKLDPTGSALLYSTYLGGSTFEVSLDIAVDNAGNAYVTGTTLSTDFPTTPGAFDVTFNGPGQDAFVAKISTATIGELISQVAGLGLNAGQANSLTSKLQAAERSLARGNATPAINQLNAFINQVRALEQSGRLDGDTAERLIAQTQAIIGQL